MIVLLIIAALFQLSAGLIGYDCGSRLLNITTLSLLDVAPCDIPDNQLNVTRKYVQLLQINEFTNTKVIQCKLEIQRSVYHCGMFSHISIVKNGQAEFISEISRRACYEMYNTGILRYGNNVISGIKINQTSSHSIVYAGFVNSDGRCNGAAYSDPYGSWESVVVQGLLKITVKDQSARVDIDNNKIHLASGTTCTLSDVSCLDSEGGFSFWNSVPSNSCKFHKYSVLYEGYTNKIVDMEQSQTVYSLSTDDITFALQTKGTEPICGYTLIKTEHPKLVIFETARGESFTNSVGISVDNLDIFAYVNSKFVYVEKHIRTQIKQLYRDTLMQRCNIERHTLKNALAIATQAPDQFAYNLMKGPGFMAVTAGEVVHIVKCVPVEVKLEESDECYAELRVNRYNKTWFLTPRTHVLKGYGTRTECNRLLPPHYLIDDNWYKMMPKPVEAMKPTVIKPMTKPTWKYVNPASLATSGIYTERDLNELRDRIMFPVERPALLNDIAREIHSLPVTDNEGTLAKLLNEDAVEKIMKTTWGRTWDKFMTFGTISAGFITILIIIQALKMFIEILINGYALHQVYGWSIHLLGAVWSSIAHLLLVLSKPKETSNPPAELIPQTNTESSPTTPSTSVNVTEPAKNNQGFFSLPS